MVHGACIVHADAAWCMQHAARSMQADATSHATMLAKRHVDWCWRYKHIMCCTVRCTLQTCQLFVVCCFDIGVHVPSIKMCGLSATRLTRQSPSCRRPLVGKLPLLKHVPYPPCYKAQLYTNTPSNTLSECDPYA
jgi:hypothetical protein